MSVVGRQWQRFGLHRFQAWNGDEHRFVVWIMRLAGLGAPSRGECFTQRLGLRGSQAMVVDDLCPFVGRPKQQSASAGRQLGGQLSDPMKAATRRCAGWGQNRCGRRGKVKRLERHGRIVKGDV